MDRGFDPAGAPRERLTFNYGVGTVPGRKAVEAAIAAGREPTFATSTFAEEARDWGYVGLLAFTAVLLFRPQDTIPGLAALHLAEVCAVIGILPMALHRFAQRLPVFRVTPETMGLLLFGAVMLATAPFSIWTGGAVTNFLDYAKIVIVFILMMNTLTSTKRIERLTWLIVIACGYIALRSSIDYARGVNLAEGNRLAGAVGGIFGNPNDLALNMVTFLPVAAMVVMNPRASALRRLTAAAIAALMLATIVFTKSRGGFLGLIAMLGALVFFTRKVRPGFGVAMLVAVVAAAPLVPSSFWARIGTIGNEQADEMEFTGSAHDRRMLMEEGLKVFLEFPLTGVGQGQFKNYNPPDREVPWRETHNALLQVAAELGVFGLAAFVFLIVRAAVASVETRRALSRPRRRRDPDRLALVMSDAERQTLYTHAAAMSAGLVGWFVCSIFASVAYSWTFYYLLALTVVAREIAAARLAALDTVERKGTSPTVATFSRRAAHRVA